ncbi:Helix-loop-helix DNA-Hypothetical protein domain [Nesidiocoris tenuis]|uniref:Uncharacterized protein n=2 Tax=Nesidiocoris tenuis TaxID=355587 RepID=A0ABN7B2Q5_9HEMI|nr:Helix-loop-helix DNA-Hypothetical protein domain [Nesidiocoris tenuis]
MAPPGMSNKTLATPANHEASGSGLNTPVAVPATPLRHPRLSFSDVVDKRSAFKFSEGHASRLDKLKKELDYLQETAWMYPSIETYIGHH